MTIGDTLAKRERKPVRTMTVAGVTFTLWVRSSLDRGEWCSEDGLVVYPRSTLDSYRPGVAGSVVYGAYRRVDGKVVQDFGDRFRDLDTAMKAAVKGVTIDERRAKVAARAERQERIRDHGLLLLKALEAVTKALRAGRVDADTLKLAEDAIERATGETTP